MLEYSIMNPEGMLLPNPCTLLSKADFDSRNAVVDSYLANRTSWCIASYEGFSGMGELRWIHHAYALCP
ncbi:hypothetical protein SFSGTM_15400 [Sulfuriferula nivalis]|uniref:Uncharacterized protein n=1 Tax=Sulfuriferula nivalis TaxID=2675298 RepID=A0A809S9C6_9PROT|nr:hypothetical protein SFSGTM_15400 [Sulfuriferula nivalis]